MVGLQGSGKTTTTAKLAKRLAEKNGKRVLMASLDTNRPAAMEQLQILGAQIGVDTLPIVKGENAVQIARRARQQATLGGYDVYMLDTAGRLHIDDVLMDEVRAVRDAVNPRETLLVVDGLTGQDAVNVAAEFDGKVGITGVVLTRMDGDGRGGAALSMRAVTGKPIRFVGLGEKMDALDTFDAERVAGRILGMGDIVALVEKARETFEAEQAERMARRFARGLFNMNDLKLQLEQMLKMGGMQGVMGMMPGMAKMSKAVQDAGFDDRFLKRQIALIQSMTKKERANPDLLQASRRRRIAAGAGLEVSELNKLLKQHRQMADMMKRMGKGGMMKQAVKSMFGKGGGGGLPDMGGVDPSKMDPAAMEAAARELGAKLPGGFGGGGLAGLGGLKLPGGLPGGLSGLGGFGRKK
jgi:signal recognition particle subunit SRP54